MKKVIDSLIFFVLILSFLNINAYGNEKKTENNKDENGAFSQKVQRKFDDISFETTHYIKNIKHKEYFNYSVIKEPFLLKEKHVYDMKTLLRNLYNHNTLPQKRAWNLLDNETKALIKKLYPFNAIDKKSRKAILKGINRLLRRRDFYDKEIFSQLSLYPKTLKLLEKGIDNLNEEELIKTNRLLFRAVFPNDITMSFLSVEEMATGYIKYEKYLNGKKKTYEAIHRMPFQRDNDPIISVISIINFPEIPDYIPDKNKGKGGNEPETITEFRLTWTFKGKMSAKTVVIENMDNQLNSISNKNAFKLKYLMLISDTIKKIVYECSH